MPFVSNSLEEYSGLLFKDENGELYSTDLGEILKKLMIPPVVAGEMSDILSVRLINKHPFSVENIRLMLDYYEEVPNTLLKFSNTRQPFMLQDELVFEGVYEPNEEIEFFVRFFTTRKSVGKGKFTINVKAAPVI